MTVFLQNRTLLLFLMMPLRTPTPCLVGASAAALRLPTLQGLNTGKRKGWSVLLLLLHWYLCLH
jgi:hypothetical protein